MPEIEVGKPIEGVSIEQTIKQQREFFAGEGDLKAYYWAESLRKETESLQSWQITKEKARNELERLPETLFDQIFERLDPYLENMPAGHSQGHAKRDFITSIILSTDPDNANLDDVERLVGIFGGTFHDIGNSVINRYEENQRFAGHAEVGAYLFGELTKDLIPPNLLKLIQYSITAHTNYRKDIPLTKEVDGREITVTKRVYEDEVSGQERKGILLTRMADRLDAQGIMHIIRHAIVKVEPTVDYDPNEMKFHAVKEDEKQDFIHQFQPVLRTADERRGLPAEEATANLLEHTKIYRDNAFVPSEHNRGHSEFFTEELVRPAVAERDRLVEAVLDENPQIPDEKIDEAYEAFYKACRLIEPGVDIEAVIGMFKDKFALLTPEVRKRWANGFILLPELYQGWYERTQDELNQNFDNLQVSESTRNILKDGNKVARQMLLEFEWK